MRANKIRWGIMGAGNVAHKFVDAVQHSKDTEIVAIASKTKDKANVFARKYGLIASENYTDIVQRSDIDAIYVATTHNFHFVNAKLALEHNKHVLVEKPFTVNEKEAATLASLAKAKRLFLMEAIWTRFLPSILKLRDIVQSGTIGDLRYINLSFGVIAKEIYKERLTQPALAGGATLDMGIYPITLANYLLGSLPVSSHSMMMPAKTGVDEIAVYHFQYENDCIATIATSYNLITNYEALIYGSKGFISFPKFQQGQSFTIHRTNGLRDKSLHSIENVTIPNHDNGFIYQIKEVVDCIQKGSLESQTIPLRETIMTMALLDSMRKQWGLIYPSET